MRWVSVGTLWVHISFAKDSVLVRFHVDKLSSAHVYLRLKEGETLDDVPTNIIEEAAQLVKANSIQVSSRLRENRGRREVGE